MIDGKLLCDVAGVMREVAVSIDTGVDFDKLDAVSRSALDFNVGKLNGIARALEALSGSDESEEK